MHHCLSLSCPPFARNSTCRVLVNSASGIGPLIGWVDSQASGKQSCSSEQFVSSLNSGGSLIRSSFPSWSCLIRSVPAGRGGGSAPRPSYQTKTCTGSSAGHVPSPVGMSGHELSLVNHLLNPFYSSLTILLPPTTLHPSPPVSLFLLDDQQSIIHSRPCIIWISPRRF